MRAMWHRRHPTQSGDYDTPDEFIEAFEECRGELGSGEM